MSADDRARWDAHYAERADEPLPPPDPFLLHYTPPAPYEGARALDVACGWGQNGLWLAEQGYRVDLRDTSRVALTRAQSEATTRGLARVNARLVDLDHAALETDAYDVVCVFRYLNRDLFPALRAAVRPGGRIVYATFNERYAQAVLDFNPAYLLEIGELAGVFADWRVLRHDESGMMSRMVAVKP